MEINSGRNQDDWSSNQFSGAHQNKFRSRFGATRNRKPNSISKDFRTDARHKKPRRTCKFGADCRFLKKGHCKFFHPQNQMDQAKHNPNPNNVGEITKRGTGHQKSRNSSKRPKNVFKVRQWSRIDDPSELKSQINLEALFEIWGSEHLRFQDFTAFCRVISTLLENENDSLARVICLRVLEEEIITNKAMESLRGKLAMNPESLSRSRLLETIQTFSTLWKCARQVVTIRNDAADKIQTQYLAKLSQHVIKKAHSFRDLCLDEHEHQIITLADQLQAQSEEIQNYISLLGREKNSNPKSTKLQNEQSQNILKNENNYSWNPPFPLEEYSDYPSVEEIKGEAQSYFKPLLVERPYPGPSEYVDRHYRLLRQDLLSGLQKGFKNFKTNHSLPLSRQQKNFDITLYKKVWVDKFTVTNHFSGICVRIQSEDHQRSFRKFSNKLMFGGVVLLSRDEFQTFYIGIIRQRKEAHMKQTFERWKYVEVYVEVVNTELDIVQIFSELAQRKLMMMESKVYFEAYFHNLKVLKQTHSRLQSGASLGLQNLLISGQSALNAEPAYLNAHAKAVIRERTKVLSAILDKRQLEAVTNALSKSLSLIQGPPGTGKTFVGVKIMRILLELKQSLAIEIPPILMICYTNHALDQFLEQVAEFTSEICRLGGRSKKDSLKQFSFHRVKQEFLERGVRSSQAKSWYHSKKTEVSKLRETSFSLFQNTKLKVISRTGFCELVSSENVSLARNFEDYYSDKVSQSKANFVHDQNFTQEEQKLFHWWFENFVETSCFLPFFVFLKMIDFRSIAIYFKRHLKRLGEQKGKRDLLFKKKKRYLKRKTADVNVTLDNEEDFEAEEESTLADDEYELYQEHYPELAENQQRLSKIDEFLQMKEFLSQNSGLSVEEYIENQHRTHQVQTENPAADSLFEDLIHQRRVLTLDHLKNLNIRGRWRFNYLLSTQYKDQLKANIQIKIQKLAGIEELYKEAKANSESEMLEDLDIIAMTTTGASKYKTLLNNLKSKVIIVEEAAEVLEAHVISSLTEATQHLILIGDHQQLRPGVSDFTLAEKFNLKISLFERLVLMGFESVRLEIQRRMRPCISELVRLIYPSLEDGAQVSSMGDVRGMESNFLFFTHEHPEKNSQGSGSKVNVFEAQMILALTDHLLKQKIKPQNITILSLYLGQLLHIRHTMGNKLRYKGVQVKTVDNYQGEENDIILLSLVRSNQKSNIGFLKVTNRVCVSISRAKQGMYIFGNCKTLRNHAEKLEANESSMKKKASNIWKDIITSLQQSNRIVTKFTITCANHGEVSVVERPQDFRQIPNGGCNKMCDCRLDCGHTCRQICHVYEKTHSDKNGHSHYRCLQACQRPNSKCEHPCTYNCFQCKDGPRPCKEKVTVFYKCQHKNVLDCDFYMDNPGKCMEQCAKELPCGHKCKKKCFADCFEMGKDQKRKGFVRPCKEYVDKELQCGHSARVPCGMPLRTFVQREEYQCQQKCGSQMENCGHVCSRKCFLCVSEKEHELCRQKCGKSLICNHVCQEECAAEDQMCPPCLKDCGVACSHSKCVKQCGEICIPCVEPCQNSCEHWRCTNLCYQVCNRPPCSHHCKQKLDCGHCCLGICGEPCPAICRDCDPSNESFQIFFGTEDEVESRFILLPDCDHSFEVQSLDKYIKLKHQGSSIQYVKCPKCSTNIMNCLRYQRFIKKTHLTIDKVKQESLLNLQQQKEQCISIPKFEAIQRHLEFIRRRSDLQNVSQIVETGKIYRANVGEILHSNQICSGHISTVGTITNIFHEFVSIIANDRHWQVLNSQSSNSLKFGKFLNLVQRMRLSHSNLERLETIVNCVRLYLFVDKIMKQSASIQYHFQSKSFGNHSYEEIIFLLRKLNSNFLKKDFDCNPRNLETAERFAKVLGDVSEPILTRNRIVRAIGLGKGHWYECPNGHPYVIADCGGATEVSKCNECGEDIGGTSHQLLDSNRHAGYMDDSSRPAYHPDHGVEYARRIQDRFGRGLD